MNHINNKKIIKIALDLEEFYSIKTNISIWFLLGSSYLIFLLSVRHKIFKISPLEVYFTTFNSLIKYQNLVFNDMGWFLSFNDFFARCICTVLNN